MEPACSKSIVLKDGEHRLEKVGLLEWGCSKTVVNLNILNLCYLLGRLHGVTIYGFLVANCELSAERCLDSLPRISWWHWICWISATAEVSSAMFQLLNLVTWLSWLPMATLKYNVITVSLVHVCSCHLSHGPQNITVSLSIRSLMVIFQPSWCSDHAHRVSRTTGRFEDFQPWGRRGIAGIAGFLMDCCFLLGFSPISAMFLIFG